MDCVSTPRRTSITRGVAAVVAVSSLVAFTSCRSTETPTVETTPSYGYSHWQAARTPASTLDVLQIASCAAFERMPHATPAAAVEARFQRAGTPGARPAYQSTLRGSAPTPERLPHLTYTFASQSEAALDTYLTQWRDNVVPRSEADIARLDAVEQAVYGAYAAFRFGPDAPPFVPEAFWEADDSRLMPPGGYAVVPTVVTVSCAPALVDARGAFGGREYWADDRPTFYLANFRPPSPDPARTLYLTADESLTLHHFLGAGEVYAPPLGLIDVAPLPYPQSHVRAEWLRRRLHFVGYNFLTPPFAQRILLDPSLTHAVVRFRDGPSTGGSMGLAKDGQGWRVVTKLSSWIE